MKITRELSSYERDYFLSFQFLAPKDFIFPQDGEKHFEGDFVSAKNFVYQQSLDYIKKNYSHTIGKKIGLFFSGGLDSYFLLHILGQAFPDLTIELFTFYHPAEYQNIEKLKQHLSTIQNIVFTPLECSYSYKHFCALFSTVYKNQNEIIGDEGYYSYLTFFELLKERNDIDTFFSADGIDVLFGGLELYRYSEIEAGNFSEDILQDPIKREYFSQKRQSFSTYFFYKYGEYFGGKFLQKRQVFDDFLTHLESSKKLGLGGLQQNIFFNTFFWIPERKKYIFSAAKYYEKNIIAPFTDTQYASLLKSYSFPRDFLIDETENKKLIRSLVGDFFPGIQYFDFGKLHLKDDFTLYKEDIIQKVFFLKQEGIITQEHFDLVPYFIKHSYWYENRMRIYLLLQLYFFLVS